MKNKVTLKGMLLLFGVACLLVGCSSPKHVAYYQGVENAEIIDVIGAETKAITVQPYDKISIIVSSKDPVLSQMFNLHVFTNSQVERTGTNGTGAEFRDYNVGYSDGINGFTVSAQGTIDYPVLGVIKVAGMTRNELAAFIKGEIMGRGLIKDPVVTVEFLNIGISVLGEVKEPGRYDMNVDVLTIMEAIALAGDLTIQGKRENVLVVRRDGDKVQTFVVDLSDAKKLLQSPAYYLKQGDVVYVEPNKVKKMQTTANGNNVLNASFWISVASLLTTAAVLFKK